ncbi:hypothetical protein [Novacetimonas sp. GS1]|uniref:hypothetical protein n=1 Tax=Novacetimonas sp. GS1 TaxID=3119990 RepID=UPI002FCD6284
MDTPYRTVEQISGVKPLTVDPTARNAQSLSPGLENIEGSTVPGTSRCHVRGPQQSPVDPAAAGLDTTRVVQSASERARATETTPQDVPVSPAPVATAPAATKVAPATTASTPSTA